MSERLSTNTKNYTIQYTTQAWLKIFTMAKLCEKNECAAFGKITRDGDTFTVHDIYIYPQLITGTTVTSDDEEYIKWLMDLPDDVRENLKFQVHSHVKMGVTPSNIDLPTYRRTVETIPKDDYILFMIVNQRDEYSLRLYEKTDDTIYHEEDLSVVIVDQDGKPLEDWYAEEEYAKIKEQVVATPTTSYHTPFYEDSLDSFYTHWDHSKEPAKNKDKFKVKSKTKTKTKEQQYKEEIAKGMLISTERHCPDCGARLYLRPRENDYLCLKCTETYTKKELAKYESI